MASDLGVCCHPRTSDDIAHDQVNSKAATRDLWLCLKDHWFPLDPVQTLPQ